MSGDVHVRFCERLAVQFRRPTHPPKMPLIPEQHSVKHFWRIVPIKRSMLAAESSVPYGIGNPRMPSYSQSHTS